MQGPTPSKLHVCFFLVLILFLSMKAQASPQINSVLWDPIAVGGNQCASGSAFGTTAGTVLVNGAAASSGSIVSWTDSQVCFNIPSAVGVGTATLQIVNGANSSNIASFSVVAAPSISSIPGSAGAGANLTVTGSNFGNAQNTVLVNTGSTWNPSSLAIVSWTDTQIIATLPATAQLGTYVLDVSTRGLRVFGGTFDVVALPQIASVQWNPVAVGGTQCANGTNFGTSQGSVALNGAAASISSWTSTQVCFIMPSAAGIGTGVLQISNGAGASNGVSFAIAAAESISSINPTTLGPAWQIIVTGANFGSVQGTVLVNTGSTWNPTSLSVSSWTDTQIVATIPSTATLGSYVLDVSTKGLKVFGGSFTVAALPQINSLQWNPIAIGVQQCVTGVFGTSQGSVIVNGATLPAASIASWSNTQVCFVMPSTAGAGTATVQIANGAGAGNVVNVTVAAAPSISSFSPATAGTGGQLTIAGSGLGPAQSGSYVQLLSSSTGAAANMTIANWANTQILATVPSGLQAGSYGIYIRAEGQLVYSGEFYLAVAPSINSVQWNPVALTGTQCATGTGFGSIQGTVSVNGIAASVLNWGDTRVCFIVPSAAGVGTGNLQVTNGAGTSNSITSVLSSAPAIAGITPLSGPTGAPVTISGSGLGSAQSGSYLQLLSGSTGAAANMSIVSWADGQVVATAPSGLQVGSYGVYLNTEGLSTYSGEFSIVLAPVISSVTPLSGIIGTQITIAGSNFGAQQGQILLAGQAVPVAIWSNTSVTATVPAGAVTGSLVVVGANGVSSNSVSFTVDRGGPLLQLSISDAPLEVNLTSPQVVDWIHWGRISPSIPDRKDGVTPLISDYTAVNGAQPSASFGNIAFSWSDGNHPAVVSEATADIDTFVAGSGFQITVPADITAKTLNLYTEVFSGQAVLQASLSDGSATAINDQSVIDLDVGSKVYSIDFRAASPGQTLTVTFSAAPGSSGGVGLQAATLTPHLPVVSIAGPAEGQSLAANTSVPVSVTAAQFDSTINDVKAVGSDGATMEANGSPLNTNWGPLGGGHYSLTASASDITGLSGTSIPVEFDVIGQGGTLSIEEDVPASPVDLATLGSGDWILWGPLNTGDSIINNPGYIMARKAGVAPLISQYKPIGNHFINSQVFGHTLCFAGEQQTYCSGSQIIVHGWGNGFEIAAPADTSSRTLQLYVGFLGADAKVIAFLSDGSAPVATEIGGSGPPASNTTLYNVNYSAASVGQMLTVRVTLNSDQGGGQISLIGAALNGPPTTQTIPAPQITAITPNPSPSNTKVTISGTNFGSVQGQSSVYFGQIAASIVTWSDNSIEATVPSALDLGSTVQVGVISAGGTSNLVSFGVPSYKITPQDIAMIVGQSRTVAVTDNSGNLVTGLGWRTDDLTIVSLSPDDPPLITALAPGLATVWAGDVSFPITVYAADAAPLGAPLWTVPLGSGSGNLSIVPAVPSDSGADVFALDASGTLSAIAADGQPVWRISGVPGASSATIIPDFAGNALLKTPYSFTDTQGNVQSTNKIQKADPNTHQITDLYTYSPVQTDARSFSDPSVASQAAIPATDGTLFILDNVTVSIIDPSGAKPTAAVNIDKSTFNGSPQAPTVGGMIVAGDGNSYTPYAYSEETLTTTDPSTTTTHTVTHVMLLRASPDGSSAKIELRNWTSNSTCIPWMPPGHSTADGMQCTSNGPTPSPTNVSAITNADQGVAVFVTTVLRGCSSSFFSQGQLVSQSGCGDTLFHVEMDNVSQDAIASQVPDAMVLADNTGRGIAFIPALQREDGSYIGTDTDSVIFGSSNLLAVGASGGILWQTPVTATPTYITPLYATPDGGVVVQSKQVQNCQTNPDRCDPVGTPAQYVLDQNGIVTGQSIAVGVPSWTGQWYTASPTGIAESNLPPLQLALTFGAIAGGNHGNTKAAVKQEWFPSLDHCTTTPGCIGRHEAMYNALDDLIARLRNPTIAALAQAQIFDPLGNDANGVKLTTDSFIRYLTSKRPRLYDALRSNYCYDNLTPPSNEGSICNRFPRFLVRTVHDFFTGSPDTGLVTGTPSYALLVFIRPSVVGFNNLGRNLGNESRLFHEALHGITGKDDGTIEERLGINFFDHATCSITVRIQHAVLSHSLGLDPQVVDPCPTGD